MILSFVTNSIIAHLGQHMTEEKKEKERKKNSFFAMFYRIFGDSRQCLQALRITQKL